MNIFLKATLVALGIIAVGTIATNTFAGTLYDSTQGVYQLYDKEQVACSAVAVTPTKLVTAAHCVTPRNGYNIRVSKFDKHQIETSRSIHFADIKSINKDDDTALIELRDDSIRLAPVPVCQVNSFKIGDPVWAVGYPLGGELTLTEGLWTSLARLDPIGLGGVFYKTTIPIAGGNSGGALLIQEGPGYCLAGLATAVRNGVSFMSYFSTLDALQKITKDQI